MATMYGNVEQARKYRNVFDANYNIWNRIAITIIVVGCALIIQTSAYSKENFVKGRKQIQTQLVVICVWHVFIY